MNSYSFKEMLQKNFIFYLMGVLTLLFLKLFYAKASCEALRWILGPTARFVTLMTGISFSYEPGMGYVNHCLKYVIAPSCSGVRFLIILIAMLIFSFVHRTERGFLWTSLSFPVSYVLTVSVNVLRIILSIYIPLFPGQTGFSCYLTQDALHTAIGTATYFASLLIIYHLTDAYFVKSSGRQKKSRNLQYFVPAFWYFVIVLGIPFLNHAYTKSGEKFTGYAALISFVCLPILLLLFLIGTIRKHFKVLLP